MAQIRLQWYLFGMDSTEFRNFISHTIWAKWTSKTICNISFQLATELDTKFLCVINLSRWYENAVKCFYKTAKTLLHQNYAKNIYSAKFGKTNLNVSAIWLKYQHPWNYLKNSKKHFLNLARWNYVCNK